MFNNLYLKWWNSTVTDTQFNLKRSGKERLYEFNQFDILNEWESILNDWVAIDWKDESILPKIWCCIFQIRCSFSLNEIDWIILKGNTIKIEKLIFLLIETSIERLLIKRRWAINHEFMICSLFGVVAAVKTTAASNIESERWKAEWNHSHGPSLDKRGKSTAKMNPLQGTKIAN